MQFQKGFAHLLLLLIVLAVIIFAVLYFAKLLPKNFNPLSSKSEGTAIELKTEYKNPFVKESQYQNPFDSYKSPLLGVKAK